MSQLTAHEASILSTHLTADEEATLNEMIAHNPKLTDKKRAEYLIESRQVSVSAAIGVKRLNPRDPQTKKNLREYAQANLRLIAAVHSLELVNQRIDAGEKIHAAGEVAEIQSAALNYQEAIFDLLDS